MFAVLDVESFNSAVQHTIFTKMQSIVKVKCIATIINNQLNGYEILLNYL